MRPDRPRHDYGLPDLPHGRSRSALAQAEGLQRHALIFPSGLPQRPAGDGLEADLGRTRSRNGDDSGGRGLLALQAQAGRSYYSTVDRTIPDVASCAKPIKDSDAQVGAGGPPLLPDAVDVDHEQERLAGLDRRTTPDERRKRLIDDYMARFANSYSAAERGHIDDVIVPHETRPRPDPRARHAADQAGGPAEALAPGDIPL